MLSKLIFAFLAGFLMNLMPCVLPVLGLKLFALKDKKIPYGGGVLVSFMVLATFSVTFGNGLGHMSHAAFRGTLAIVCYLMGLALVGLWKVPSFPGKESASPFFTGCLTVALGTSCAVPFLAPVVVYCLQSPPLVTYTIFAAMAAGFLAPWMLPIPMPKPGPWMKGFEFGCGVVLLTVQAWLLYTMPIKPALLSVGCGMCIYSAIMSQAAGGWARLTTLPFIVGGIWLAIMLACWVPPDAETYWPRSGDRVIVAGADWCATCVTTNTVWDDEQLLKELGRLGIPLVKLDWVEGDKAVTDFLDSTGLRSVPAVLIEREGRVTIIHGVYDVDDIYEAIGVQWL